MNKILEPIKYDLILGSRRLSNYFWFATSFIGGLGFFLIGASSYFKTNLNSYLKTELIAFIPQGILMTFYGVIGLLFSMFLLLNLLFDIGGGYNKYDQTRKKIEIFRLNSSPIFRELLLTYNFKDIDCIKLSIKDGLNPKREIYLCTKDKRQIPLTRIGEPVLLSQIEKEAIDLSQFLDVPLKNQ